MAPNSNSKSNIKASSSSQFLNVTFPIMDDDDFQDYPSPSFSTASKTSSHPPRLKPHSSTTLRPSEKLKKQKPINPGKENRLFHETEEADLDCGREEKICDEEFYEGSSQLDVLLKLCADVDEQGNDNAMDYSEGKCVVLICCPICGADISGLSDDLRQIHTNECLDLVEGPTEVAATNDGRGAYQCPGQVLDDSPIKSARKVVDVSPVVEWLRNLGLAKYEEIFVRQEIDWDALQCLTEEVSIVFILAFCDATPLQLWILENISRGRISNDEDLCDIGITTLGPRKKILCALKELRNDLSRNVEPKTDVSRGVTDETKLGTNKLITDYFSGPLSERKRGGITTNGQNNVTRRSRANSAKRSIERKDRLRNGKQKNAPSWCCVPGTPFRVDAFKYLRRDCSHWFLTHFHLDHYQGLTRSFGHGMIYCSSITAKLVNLKIGIPWDKIQVLPLNQKTNIAGIDVTCFDANHCPGAIIILFEPPNGKPVLHTGDFRFCEDLAKLSILQACPIHTLILDTTYCDPQYDFPKQEAIIQFVIDAIQAEAFNPKTLFLIGSYTIGKERVFVEVAKALRKKVYVTAAKLRILECLGLQQEDMQWFTLNEQESHIHIVPMWSIASFKRMKHMSIQYMGRFSLIVAFSPTGWSFGKGKKSTGRRWQKGTIIRYEVPYSEHSSFTELKEFVKFISPVNIIPSVNNHGPDSQNSMVSQLLA
ncbi:hypothetical protein DH2020_006107 [Rehmannia glutinosa]|uniref:SAM domain-containing protein n=1 Tax=Rehmannia glutinosa TaxID=99300 RepID=A0ABR0XHW2_REHGL